MKVTITTVSQKYVNIQEIERGHLVKQKDSGAIGLVTDEGVVLLGDAYHYQWGDIHTTYMDLGKAKLDIENS